jgi:hypothetical protein
MTIQFYFENGKPVFVYEDDGATPLATLETTAEEPIQRKPSKPKAKATVPQPTQAKGKPSGKYNTRGRKASNITEDDMRNPMGRIN